MIEPILSLAISMHASPGVYALLIGSGVSRTARIPTGWEVVLDLARKLAATQKEDCEPGPAAWYHEKFGRDPDYSELLDAIGKSPSERQQLLRSYFEPNEEEREQGFKQPTPAHQAIAKLVAGGYCRVILTTNFDKLIERAIEDEGISPTVISTPDAVEGALPLVHQRCCVVKLHGDYLDTRIKNTPTELADYDERLNRLLDQVFDSFGLIVCGWSAQWDSALRAAIERCPSRRFTTYWATRGKLTDEATRLVNLRAGQTIRIQDADSFLGKLAELVDALKESKRAHPVSVQTATALVKRYLSDPRHSIELHDLVTKETEVAYSKIEQHSQEILKQSQIKNDIDRLFRQYREIVETLQAIIIHGCAWGIPEHHSLWINSIERISRPGRPVSGNTLKPAIRQYPTVVVLYAAGLAAITRQRVAVLAELLARPRTRQYRSTKPLLLSVDWGEMNEFAQNIEGYQPHRTPLSQHLSKVLRVSVHPYLPDDAEYEDCFDRFEYIQALVYVDLDSKETPPPLRPWAPLGRFCWKRHREGLSIITQIEEELNTMGEDWPLLKCGLFDGSLDRLKKAKADLDRLVRRRET